MTTGMGPSFREEVSIEPGWKKVSLFGEDDSDPVRSDGLTAIAAAM